jgi:antitoxin MazE
MQTIVQKWGNSLGVRIPKSFTKDAHIEEGTEIDLNLDKGIITLKPVKKSLSLKELLSKVSKSNIHDETVTGEVVGRELW